MNCQNRVVSGVTADGGYAEVMIAEARAISSVPDELTSADAAPLLCAGMTAYNPLRNAGLRVGDPVAVQASVAPAILASSEAADAYARMMQGKARFPMVLVTKGVTDQREASRRAFFLRPGWRRVTPKGEEWFDEAISSFLV